MYTRDTRVFDAPKLRHAFNAYYFLTCFSRQHQQELIWVCVVIKRQGLFPVLRSPISTIETKVQCVREGTAECLSQPGKAAVKLVPSIFIVVRYTTSIHTVVVGDMFPYHELKYTNYILQSLKCVLIWHEKYRLWNKLFYCLSSIYGRVVVMKSNQLRCFLMLV